MSKPLIRSSAVRPLVNHAYQVCGSEVARLFVAMLVEQIQVYDEQKSSANNVVLIPWAELTGLSR